MRSRAEWLLRGLALASLALLLSGVFARDGKAPRVVEGGDNLVVNLREATRSPASHLVTRFDAAPDRMSRDWLAALRGAGVSLSWDAQRAPSVAIQASPIAEPVGGTRIVVTGSRGETVALADSLGLIDSVRIASRATAIRARTAAGRFTATSGATIAFTDAPRPLPLKRVLVLGPAGWEAKFLVTALEEMGWGVDVRLDVAPGAVVSQGTGLPDTARHSAVVLLDGSGAVRASSVARYVAQGGGAILVGSATRLGALERITPGLSGQRMAGRPRAEGAARDTASVVSELPAMRLLNVRADATVLVARGAALLVAARRVERGRVVASGLDETWRWRMRPDSGARAAHAEWWSSLVGSVAMADAKPTVAQGQDGDPAPLAALSMALGPSAPVPPSFSGGERPWLEVFLYGVFLAAFLAEILSRRTRGLA